MLGIIAVCAFALSPTPPAHATDAHLAAWEAWQAEQAQAQQQECREAIIDLNGPYTVPASVVKKSTPSLTTAPHYSAGVEQWRGLVSQWPWPVEQVLAVMDCESGGNSNAVGAAGEIGLMQIHPASWEEKYGPREDWFDPQRNLEVAYILWAADGWQHWSCRRVLS